MFSVPRAPGTPWTTRSFRNGPLLHALVPAVLAGACLSPLLAAQDGAPPAPVPPPAPAAQDNAELQRQLAEERAARLALEKRLAALESKLEAQQDADLEAQLRSLVNPADLQTAPPRTIFPSALNPRIGVFTDFLYQAGDYDSKIGPEHSNGFNLREAEIDMRLPISPFAEGVLVAAYENEGDNDFNSTIEEAYANLGLGGLLDNDWKTSAKLGRFRPIFGRNNQLHLHDWMQVFQPLPFRNLLGDEGVIGNGVGFDVPLLHFGEAAGEGQTTTLNAALVNGEILTFDETAFGELASDSGVSLSDDGPVLVARLSQFMELGKLSDVELGVSNMSTLDSQAIEADSDTHIAASYWDLDATWRSRDDETGVGSWLVQAEWIHSDFDYGDTGNPDFPTGNEARDGWWLTTQRQMLTNWYLGLLYARSDELGNDDKDRSISPYLTWYADEFFRIRWQVDVQSNDVDDGPNIDDAIRGLMQFTWNFGAHSPHPYWVNR